jgi:hypothetical protein
MENTKLKPRPETKKKMLPISRDAFHKLLNKAATTEPPVLKRVAKSA